MKRNEARFFLLRRSAVYVKLLQAERNQALLRLLRRSAVYVKVAHFNTIDPKADQYPELNPYLYCTGNPLMYVDPTGMKVYKNAQQLYDKGMEAINNEKFQPGYTSTRKT